MADSIIVVDGRRVVGVELDADWHSSIQGRPMIAANID